MFLNMGLYKQLFLVFVGLAIVPLLLVGITASRQSYIDQAQQAIALQKDIALRVAEQIEQYIITTQDDIYFHSAEQSREEPTRADYQESLTELMLRFDDIIHLTIFNMDGELIAQVSHLEIITNEPQKQSDLGKLSIPFTESIRTKSIYYSPVWFSEDTNEPIITGAIPILELQTGEVEIVLLFDMRLKFIRELVTDRQVNAGKTIYIIDADGHLIAHQNPSLILRRANWNVPAENGMAEGLEGDRVVIARQQFFIGNQILYVIVEELQSNALQLARNTLLLTIAASFFGILLALGAGAVGIRQLIVPIQTLVEMAKAVEGGDLSQRVTLKRNDELGILAMTLNTMTATLQLNFTTLEQNLAELKRANQLKRDVLANVSHELRTPLGAILGTAELLDEGVFGKISEKQREAINRIAKSGDFLTSLVNELLDQAQLDAGKIILRPVQFNPEIILDAVVTQMEILAHQKGLQIVGEVDPALTKQLVGDSDRLQQILFNLVNNAVKFSNNGTVHIRLYVVDTSRWGISVTDFGIGIPKELQAHIFEPFGQVDSSNTREHGGAGLGLSIVKRLVEVMGGELTLDSKLGQGSCFSVILPLQRVAHSSEEL